MRLQYHVISLEMAQALHGIGVRQGARYAWWNDMIVPSDGIVPMFTKNVYAAYDAAEIGWMLPKCCPFETEMTEHGAIIRVTINDVPIEYQAQTEVGARARLLLKLIEERVIDPFKVSSSLFKKTDRAGRP